MRAWASAGGANVWISTCKSSDKCEYLYSPLNLSSSSCARSEKKARRMRWKIKANLFSSCFVFVPFSYPALSLVLILTSCTSSPLVVVSANYLSVLEAFRRNWTANHNSKTITIVFCKETKVRCQLTLGWSRTGTATRTAILMGLSRVMSIILLFS